MSNKKREREKRRQAKMLERKISSKMSKKLVGLFLVVILALVGLAVRITYVNATDGEKYSRTVLSQAQQSYGSRTIPFKRGDILDRNGEILATSEKVYNVILDCKVVNDITKDEQGNEEKKYFEPTVDALVNVLGLDEQDIRGRLENEETKNSQYQILVKSLSITEKKKFEAYVDVDSDENQDLSKEEKLKRQRVKGVWFEEAYLRTYPLKSLACDLIGFTYTGNTADWGIEGYYSSALNGTNGRQYGYFNTDADVEQTIIPAVDGSNVVSTVDANIQQIVRSALEKFDNAYTTTRTITENGGSTTEVVDSCKNAAVIVMDPNNGEVLAMDSTDWYDLNDPRDLTGFCSAEEIASMNDAETLDKLNSIWRNYCISDAFEPGSTFKPVTVSAALDSGAVKITDVFECDGYEFVGPALIKCSAFPDFHGELTPETALVNSCNDALMQIAAKLGKEEFLHYQELFNFGHKTGIDLPGENSGLLFNTDTMGEVELATSSFGQGFTCTMIQEASAFCTTINGGYYYKPHVVSAITDSSGNVLESVEKVVERQAISTATSDNIREFLGGVPRENGTGYMAKVDGYSMGGKTGTAQKLPRDSGKYIVSFVGFAPLDAPQVLVYVIVDEPNVEDQSKCKAAQEITKLILKELLPYMNIYPDEPYTGKEAASDYIGEIGANNDAIASPPPAAQDDTVQNGGNDLLEDGITNDQQAYTQN